MRAPTATSSQHKAQLLKDFGQLMPFLDTKQPTLLYRTFCLLNAGLLPTISQLTFLLSLDDHVSLAELHLCNITPNYEKQNSKNQEARRNAVSDLCVVLNSKVCRTKCTTVYMQ